MTSLLSFFADFPLTQPRLRAARSWVGWGR
jgi:hypothetical protein